MAGRKFVIRDAGANTGTNTEVPEAPPLPLVTGPHRLFLSLGPLTSGLLVASWRSWEVEAWLQPPQHHAATVASSTTLA